MPRWQVGFEKKNRKKAERRERSKEGKTRRYETTLSGLTNTSTNQRIETESGGRAGGGERQRVWSGA